MYKLERQRMVDVLGVFFYFILSLFFLASSTSISNGDLLQVSIYQAFFMVLMCSIFYVLSSTRIQSFEHFIMVKLAADHLTAHKGRNAIKIHKNQMVPPLRCQ